MGSCYNSIVVDVPREKVWETIKDFHDLSWADPVITKLEIVGDKTGSQIGAQRHLNDAFLERLVSVDEEGFTFTYSIDDGPEPLGKDAALNYVGTVRLLPVTDSDATFVEWTSSFQSDSDQAVSDFCNPVYVALLGALKAHLA